MQGIVATPLRRHWESGLLIALTALGCRADQVAPTGSDSGSVPVESSGSDDEHASGDASTGGELDSAADSTNSDTDETGASDSSSGEQDPCTTDLIEPGQAPIRRLTRIQYNQTIGDLFPGIAFPDYALPDAAPVHGLLNDARLQSASALLIEGLQRNALDITTHLVTRPELWLACLADPDPAQAPACGQQLIERYGPSIHRRPLTPESEGVYREFFAHHLAESGLQVGIALTLQAMLQAPEFVYLHEPEGDSSGSKQIRALDGYSLAQRLSYFLWNSLPDAELFAAAQRGELGQADKVRAQAERMLQDPRARAAAIEFHRQWFDLAALERVHPDAKTHPDFSESLRAAMAEEFARFVGDEIFAGPGRAGDLLRSRDSFVNAELAQHYGLQQPDTGTDWFAIEHDASQRAGLLTSAAFLAGHAQSVHPSPVQRGLFVMRRLLCIDLPNPPGDVDTSLPDDDGTPGTNRDRYTKHLGDDSCRGCHALIDPIGFTFEHYDATGRYRTHDNNIPVDARAQTLLPGLIDEFDNALELTHAIADAPAYLDCLARHWTSYALGHIVTDDNADPAFERDSACILHRLRTAFRASDGDLRGLWLDLAVSDAFRHRRGTP